jgi:acetyltransferase-like isoleucine patch superfamily enzyme
VLSKRTHDFSRVEIPIRLQGGISEAIHIGKDAWIGNGAIIMAHVGEKSIIGAGSVVVKNVEAYAVAVGNPARVIKKRDPV